MSGATKIRPVESTAAPPDRRAALRASLTEREADVAQLRLAQQAEARGRELLEAAESKLSEFGGLDAAVLAHQAKKFERAAKGGPAPDTKLPDDLIKRRAARDEAREYVAGAKAAHDSLVAERAQAENAMRKAEQRVSEAAVAILVGEGISQAAALVGAWKTLWDTVDALNALAGSWLPTPVKLPPDVIRMLQLLATYDRRQFAGNCNSGLKQAGQRWRVWHAALCNDADAEMPDLVNDGVSCSVVERVA